MEFKDRLNQRMQELGLNGAEMCRRTGIDKASMSQYRSGKTMPNAEKIVKIASALNVSEQWLMGGDVAPQAQTVIVLDGYTVASVPVFESVSAGFGAEAHSNIIDYIPVALKPGEKKDDIICLKVKGDSMSPLIQNNDIVIVRRQPSVDSGDVAVVLLDGTEGFVKRVEYDLNEIRLVSENMNYRVISLSGANVQRCRVIGKVLRVEHDI